MKNDFPSLFLNCRICIAFAFLIACFSVPFLIFYLVPDLEVLVLDVNCESGTESTSCEFSLKLERIFHT